MPQPLPAQKRNVFEAVNHVLFPVYFYVRLVLNFVGIVLLLLLHPGTVFAHDRWRLVAGLVFGFVSAAIVVLSAFFMWPFTHKRDAHALLVWLVSLEFLAPCVIIGAGMLQADLHTRAENFLFWGTVVLPDAIFVLLPRSVAGVITFYTSSWSSTAC